MNGYFVILDIGLFENEINLKNIEILNKDTGNFEKLIEIDIL